MVQPCSTGNGYKIRRKEGAWNNRCPDELCRLGFYFIGYFMVGAQSELRGLSQVLGLNTYVYYEKIY